MSPSLRLPARLLPRLIVLLVFFFGMWAPAVAGQINPDGLKDRQDSEESATPDASPAAEENPGLVGEGEYVSPQTGTEITWTDAWDLGDMDNPLVAFAASDMWDEPITSDQEGGDVVFLMDTATESSVLQFILAENVTNLDPTVMETFLGQPTTLEDNLFIAPDSEILLLDSNDEAAVIMARDGNDTDHVLYLSVNFSADGDTFTWVGIDLWEPENYESVLNAFAEDVEISDVDPFSVEPVDTLIELALSEPAEASPEADDTPEADATEEATEEAATEEADETPDVDVTEEADETPDATDEATEEADETPETDADLPGLIAEGEYESPQFGAAITWTDAWTIDESRDEPVGINEDDRYDFVFLTDAATESTVVYMTVEEISSSDPDDILETITKDGYNEDVFGVDPDSETLLQDSTEDAAAILVIDYTQSDPLVILMEVHALDDEGLVAFVDFRAYASDLDEDVLAALEDDLEVEGQPGLTVFTADEILAALETI